MFSTKYWYLPLYQYCSNERRKEPTWLCEDALELRGILKFWFRRGNKLARATAFFLASATGRPTGPDLPRACCCSARPSRLIWSVRLATLFSPLDKRQRVITGAGSLFDLLSLGGVLEGEPLTRPWETGDTARL